MATNNFSEYTSLLQGYQKKRKSKKKKVIAAAALTFFKNLADKALTRNTANELAGYKSEYTKLATDASSEYKKQENFVNIGTTRGGGDYTYATTDEGEDTINFQYPDKIKQSFIIDEVDSGRKLLNTQYGSDRAMDKKYVDHLTKIGEQRYQNWQDNKGAYDFSIRSESDATEGIRKALLLTAKEFKKPRYADSIANLGYKWFNKEVKNPALLELAKVKRDIQSIKSSRDENIKGIESTEFKDNKGKPISKVTKLSLSMAQRVALKERIDSGDLTKEKDAKGIDLTTDEHIKKINKRFEESSILQLYGFSDANQLLAVAITPITENESIFTDTSSKKVVYDRRLKEATKNIFNQYKNVKIPENINKEIEKGNYESLDTVVSDAKILRDVKLNLINAKINTHNEVYSFSNTNENILEFAKFNIETNYLKSLLFKSPEYINRLDYIKAEYKNFLSNTTGNKFNIVKNQVNDEYKNYNTQQLKAKSNQWLGSLEYLIKKAKTVEEKEKLEQIETSILTQTTSGEEVLSTGLLQTLDAIEKMNVVYNVTDLDNEGLYPFVDGRPEEWMQKLVEASLNVGRF